MPTISFQTCSDNPSYFSAKCSQCGFSCLKGEGEKSQAAAASRSGLSVPGLAGVAAGAAASLAGYPIASAGLTVLGAAAIISRIINK